MSPLISKNNAKECLFLLYSCTMLQKLSFLLFFCKVIRRNLDPFFTVFTVFTNFSENLCFNNFCVSRKKGPRPKWTIYKHESDKNKKCLSVDNSGILFVVCSEFTAYTCLCRDLKYLLKVGYIILVFPNVT